MQRQRVEEGSSLQICPTFKSSVNYEIKEMHFCKNKFLNSEDDMVVNFEELLNRNLDNIQRCPILN